MAEERKMQLLPPKSWSAETLGHQGQEAGQQGGGQEGFQTAVQTGIPATAKTGIWPKQRG